MKILTERNGLVLNRVLEHNIHGKSYIFEIKLSKDDTIYNVDKYLDDEEKLGLYSNSIYEQFSSNTFTIINNLKNEIEKYKNNDYKCIGFGAAAKGQTILCVGNINLDYIIDENPMKIGEFSPKLDIPIVSLDHFINDKNNKFLIVILAWNFAKEIKEKINKIKENKKIIVIENYFPDIVINDI
jgi:hypothetical protein